MTIPGGSRTIRALVMLLVGLALLPVAVLVYRNGIAPNDFHYPGTGDPGIVVIERYNGAWIAGAFGLVILAGLLLVSAVNSLLRLRGARSASTVMEQ